MSQTSIGWADKPQDHPDVVALRSHLASNSGIKGLEIVKPTATDQIVTLFRRDGFVVVSDILNDEQIAMLAEGCQEVIDEILALDHNKEGNRGSHRYSFGGSSLTRSQLHRPAWQMLLEITQIWRLVEAIFGSSDFSLRSASGDFCLPGAIEYQRLHADHAQCDSLGEAPGCVALAWLLHQPGVAATIIGPASSEQLTSMLHVPELKLGQDVLQQLDAIFPPSGEAPEAYAW